MSQAQVSIYADIELRRNKLQQSVRDVERDIKTGLAKISQQVSVKVAATIDPDLQKKFDTAVAKITVKPIVVPVQFVAQGGMPGGAGGAGAQMPGGSPAAKGGSSGATRGDGRWSYMNPFSVRGLAHLVGGGALAYGAYEVVQMVQAAREREMAISRAGGNLDARARAEINDATSGVGGSMRNFIAPWEKDNIIDSLDETKLGDASADARYGSGMSAINARERAAIAATPAGESRVRREIANRLRLAQSATQAAGRTESGTYKEEHGRARADAERQLKDMGLDPEGSIGSALLGAIDRKYSNSLRGVGTRQGVESAAAQSEADSQTRDLGYDIDRRGIGSQGSIYQSVQASRALGYALRGDSANAMAIRQASEIQGINDDFEGRKVGKSGGELKQLQDQQAAAVGAAQEKQKVETQRFNLDRERSAADSLARIDAMEKSSADNILRAQGQTYNASVAMAKHATDEKVAQLMREAEAETDLVKKKQLTNQADAERVAGRERVRALAIEHSRQTDAETRRSSDTFGEDSLEAGGQHRAARDKRVQDEYIEKVTRINDSNDSDKAKQIANAARDRDGKMALNARQDALSDRSLGIETQDAAERANGQNGVGEALQFQARIADMMKDADTPERKAAVLRYRDQYTKAKIRELKPKSHTYGSAEYHDAIQTSISQGSSNMDAVNLWNNIGAGKGPNMNLADPAGGAGGAMGGLNMAAKAITDAANVIKNARNLGVYRKK